MLTMLALLAHAQPTPPALPEAPTPVELPATPAIPETPTGLTTPAIPAVPVLPATPALPAVPEVDSTAATRDFFDMNDAVSVSEPVADNAFIMAGEVDILAPVGGDIFSMGQAVTIDQPVAGDVYVMGATVIVTETGSVGGSLRVFAGELELRGPVAGDVSAEVGEVTLAAPIGGNLQLNTERLTIESTATIAGDLDYSSASPFPALEKTVSGKVSHSLEIPDLDDTDVHEEESSLLADATWWAGMRSWGFITKFLVGSLLFFLGGNWLAAAGRRIGTHPAQSLGAGFVTAGVLPILSTAALITVIPFPLGLLGFTLFAVLLYVGQLFAAQALGDFVLHRLRPDAVGNPYISLAVGLIPLMLLMALPWIGSIAWFVATVMGIGGLVAALRGIR